VIDGLNNVIYFYAFALYANGISFKDIASLIVRETTALEMTARNHLRFSIDL